MNWLALFNKLTKATILNKFYDSRITSEALMFSYDFALIDIPMAAYCKHGISFKPKIKIFLPSPIIITPIPSSSSKFFWTLRIHYYFIKAVC